MRLKEARERWNPTVLQEWMDRNNGVTYAWLSETCGKGATYISESINARKIAPSVLKKLVTLTDIPYSVYTTIDPEEEKAYLEKKYAFREEADKLVFGELKDHYNEYTMVVHMASPVNAADYVESERKLYIKRTDIVAVIEMSNGSEIVTKGGKFAVREAIDKVMEGLL